MVVRATRTALVAAALLLAAAQDNPPNYPKWLPRLSARRRLEAPGSGGEDCLQGARRRIMRPYPGACYSKGGSGHDYQSQWWSFWKENRGDISYTFDYVFVPKNKNALDREFENQLWYNIAYLKQLRISIPNSEDIASRSTLDKELQNENKHKDT